MLLFFHHSIPHYCFRNVMATYGRYPLTIDYGKGCNLFDMEGKKYLDFAAGIATCCLGHANPALQKAVSDQMGRVNHVSNLYYIPEQGKLAKWLVTNSCADKVFFCNSGAESNEAAIKLARKHAHTKLGIEYPVIITALQSFHGRTLTTITATGQPKYQVGFYMCGCYICVRYHLSSIIYHLSSIIYHLSSITYQGSICG